MNIADFETGAVQFRSATIEDVGDHELFVKAVPYSDDFTAIGGGIEERFVRGAFSKAEAHRLSVWHDHGGPLVGRGTAVEDRADGVYIRAKIGRTAAAEDLMSLVTDGILTDPSIEFRAQRDFMKVERTEAGLRVTHRRAHLLGFAMVPEGAYGEAAMVLSARDAQREREAEAARAWFESWRRGFTA